MTIQNKNIAGMWTRTVIVILLVCACNNDLTDDPIPEASFPDYVVNLTFPEYVKLRADGGYVIVGSIGVRGVILYRRNSTTYNAFEINCSYHPNEASANVGVDPSNLFLHCSGCGSNFNFTDGTPSGGIAWRALRRYQTNVNAGTVTISSVLVGQ